MTHRKVQSNSVTEMAAAQCTIDESPLIGKRKRESYTREWKLVVITVYHLSNLYKTSNFDLSQL